METNAMLSSSLEDYLEAIFHIVSEKQAARAKDIARRLQVNNSSVTGALRSLAEKGLVNYAPYDIITLTPEGQRLAAAIVRRHETLKDFFVKILLVDDAEAEQAACRVEHAISEKILDRIISFVEFMELCPRGGNEWLKGFRRHCQRGDATSRCAEYIGTCLEDLKKRKKQLKSPPRKPVRLDEMDAGMRGKITKIRRRGRLSNRLSELGVSAGSLVEVEAVSPGKDQIEIKVRGYHLALKTEEAAGILVEPHEHAADRATAGL